MTPRRTTEWFANAEAKRNFQRIATAAWLRETRRRAAAGLEGMSFAEAREALERYFEDQAEEEDRRGGS